MNEVFVLLGGNMLLRGMYEQLRLRGYNVVVVDWNDHPAVTGDCHLQIDVKDATKVIAALKALNRPVAGAYTCIDLAVPTVNAIHAWRGLALLPEPFNRVLTKEQMTFHWQRDGLLGRFSYMADRLSESQLEALHHTHDLIVKPNIAASSRGITVVPQSASSDRLQQALQLARETSFDQRCLVEEYISGREFTIDMLGDDQGHVSVYGISVKYHSLNTTGSRVAVKLHWNSTAYSDEVYRALADFGRRCYQSIGLQNAYGHLEVIRRDDGTVSPVEIGARTSGYISSHLLPAAADSNYLDDYLKMLQGQPVADRDHLGGPDSAMWYKYNIPPGCTGQRPVCLADYLDPRIRVLACRRKGLQKGQTYGLIRDDNSCDVQGYEMLAAPKEILTIDHIRQAERQFLRDFCGYSGPIDEN
ncbi:MAG: ATP-grasp domain-containing protein [Bacteroidales bacterium]|nr:ATP-grasp domain-containing protein [Bacteroidales bacterium]